MVFSTISDCDMTPVVAMETGRGARARPEGVRGVWRIRTPVESLLIALKDLALSTGSACTSASVEPSYVLRALGVEGELEEGDGLGFMTEQRNAVQLMAAAGYIRG